MSKTIRWGILGTGTVARDVAQSFVHVADARLVAVASRNSDTAAAFASQFKVPKAYGSYNELLADDEIDVVYIATPHERHRDDCLRSFDAGKAVLCEKPFTMNAKQAREVVATSREKGLFCMEAMWMRFIPIIRKMHELVDAGEIGHVQMIKADFGYPTWYDPENRFFSLTKGGGSLMDRGIYTLSLAHMLLGEHENLKSSATLGPTGVDHQSSYLLDYPNGAIADLSSTLTSYGTNEAVIMGTQGQIRIHDPFYRASRITLMRFEEPAAPQPALLGDSGGMKEKLKQNVLLAKLYGMATPLLSMLRGGAINKPFPGNGYQFEIAEVTGCLQRGETESSVMPLDDTLAIMETMDEMRASWGLRYPQD